MKQFIKFCTVGLSNTIISYLVYIICLRFFEIYHLFIGYDYFISSLSAFLISTFWSFCWNDRFTFKKGVGEKRSVWKALLKTYMSYSFTEVFVSNALLYLEIDRLGISKDIAPLINLSVTVPLNYLLNKYWAFRERHKEVKLH